MWYFVVIRTRFNPYNNKEKIDRRRTKWKEKIHISNYI